MSWILSHANEILSAVTTAVAAWQWYEKRKKAEEAAKHKADAERLASDLDRIRTEAGTKGWRGD